MSEYRYTLTRGPENGRRLLWIMLNPSTADETEDDPTIRRVVGFTKSLGFESLTVVNLFAARATKPKALRTMADPLGPMNNTVLLDLFREHSIAVAAWGAHPFATKRAAKVRRIADEEGCHLFALAFTKDGHPRHPLYLRKDSQLKHYPLPESTD